EVVGSLCDRGGVQRAGRPGWRQQAGDALQGSGQDGDGEHEPAEHVHAELEAVHQAERRPPQREQRSQRDGDAHEREGQHSQRDREPPRVDVRKQRVKSEVGERCGGHEREQPEQQAADDLAQDDRPQRSGHAEDLLQRPVPALVLDAVAAVQISHAPVAYQAAAEHSVDKVRGRCSRAAQDVKADRREDQRKDEPVQVGPGADHAQAHADPKGAPGCAHERGQELSPISWMYASSSVASRELTFSSFSPSRIAPRWVITSAGRAQCTVTSWASSCSETTTDLTPGRARTPASRSSGMPTTSNSTTPWSWTVSLMLPGVPCATMPPSFTTAIRS